LIARRSHTANSIYRLLSANNRRISQQSMTGGYWHLPEELRDDIDLLFRSNLKRLKEDINPHIITSRESGLSENPSSIVLFFFWHPWAYYLRTQLPYSLEWIILEYKLN
jgi:hypothetical protein